VKHFSQKPITKELIRVRTHIEENIESILEELKLLQDKGDTAGFNNSLHNLLMHEIYLSKEGVPLAESVTDRFHSVLAESGIHGERFSRRGPLFADFQTHGQLKMPIDRGCHCAEAACSMHGHQASNRKGIFNLDRARL
jgi:hypothetical protein